MAVSITWYGDTTGFDYFLNGAGDKQVRLYDKYLYEAQLVDYSVTCNDGTTYTYAQVQEMLGAALTVVADGYITGFGFISAKQGTYTVEGNEITIPADGIYVLGDTADGSYITEMVFPYGTDTITDSGNKITLKAGTYRWNDILSMQIVNGDDVRQADISFTVEQEATVTEEMVQLVYAQTNINIEQGVYTALISCNRISAGLNGYADGDFTVMSGSYNIDTVLSLTPSVPNEVLALVNSMFGGSSYFYDRHKTDGYDGLFANGFSNIITFPTDQEVGDTFGTWFISNTNYNEVNAKTLVELTYNGETLSLEAGDKATIPCAEFKMRSDVVVKVNEVESGGSGECSGNHIIEVDELPAENIDEKAIYKVKRFEDIGIFYDSVRNATSWNGLLGSEASVTYYVVKSKPTENIQISNTTDMHVYYVKDDNDILIYGDLANTGVNSWVSFGVVLTTIGIEGATFQGEIVSEEGTLSDLPDVISGYSYYALYDTNRGYYQYDGSWEHYIVPKLTNLYVTKDGTYTPQGKYDGFNSVNVKFNNERLRAIIGRTATELIPSDFDQHLGSAVGDSSTFIADYAFYSYEALTKVEIGNDYYNPYRYKGMTVGNYAFYKCSNLQSVDFENVREVGSNAFAYTGITEVRLSNVYSIGKRAFAECDSLTSVYLSQASNAQLLGADNVFENCDALKTVTIYSDKTDTTSTVVVLYKMFAGCTNLESITLDTASIPKFNDGCFPSSLQNIYVRADMVESFKANEKWSAYADIISAIVE